jgi:hypothetical protein
VLLEEKRRILEERFEEFIRVKLRFNNLGGVFLNKNCSEGSYSTLDGGWISLNMCLEGVWVIRRV